MTDLMGDYRFGVTLKALRRRAGLSQGRLGERVGLGQQAISQFELEQAWPSLPTLFGLAVALGVQVTELFRWEPDPDDDFPPADEIEAHTARLRSAALQDSVGAVGD
jgi:transcriptional regulator with XRE-family HTH domain